MKQHSDLQGGLGTHANGLLLERPGQRILAEIVTGFGRAIVQTEHYLFFVKVGPLSVDLGSRAIPISAITSVTAGPVPVGMIELRFNLRPVRGFKGDTAEAFATTPDKWPALKELIENALASHPASLDARAWDLHQTAVEHQVAERQRQTEADMKRQQAEERVRQERLATLEFSLTHLEQFTNGFELNTLYGQRPQTINGLPTEMGWGVHYWTGIPVFDDYYQNKAAQWRKPLEDTSYKVTFYNRGHGLSIELPVGFASHAHGVHWPHRIVRRVQLKQHAMDAITERNSVVAPALLGGALFGVAGAIVGGITGTSTRQTQGSGQLVFTLDTREGQHDCVFSVEANRNRTVVHFLMGIYGDRVDVSDERRAIPQLPQESSPIAAEVERLAALYRQGIITDEEFKAAKAKLLS